MLALAALTGCTTQGLEIVQDDRIDVVAPADRATVALPVTVRWTAADLPVGTTFGIAVDTALPRPGRAPKKNGEILTTDKTEISLDHLGNSDHDLHRVTVFLLDANGERLGESAWRVDMRLEDNK